jgi:hypothetical protein
VHGGPRLTTSSVAQAAVALGAAAVLLSGCSSAVEVSVPAAGDGEACRAAVAHWPATVSGMDRRDTDPASPAVAAWGDPALIARCGVPALAPTTTECVEVDGVGWIPEPLSDGTRFTSFGTDPAVEVLVPRAYAPEGLLLPAFGPVAAALPHNGLECR